MFTANEQMIEVRDRPIRKIFIINNKMEYVNEIDIKFMNISVNNT